MFNFINYSVVEDFISNIHGGTFFRIGAVSEKKVAKKLGGGKIIKKYELTGRVGCKYGNVVKGWVPSNTNKPLNYETVAKGRIKVFITTGNYNISFFPAKKANAKAEYFYEDANGNIVKITKERFSEFGGSVGETPDYMTINANNIYKINSVVAD